MEHIEHEDLVDTITAARILNLAPSTLVNHRVKRTGPAFYRIGRSIKYAINDLNEYVERQE